LLAAPGHAYNLLSAPGEISTGEVGIFQPAETGEYSTGVDKNNRARPIPVVYGRLGAGISRSK
jgi:hypothetical protein